MRVGGRLLRGPAGRAGGPPLSLTWQAAGSFEAERWRRASLPESVGLDMIFFATAGALLVYAFFARHLPRGM